MIYLKNTMAENKKMETTPKEGIFNEEYFESDKWLINGGFRSYRYEDYYPLFIDLAIIIRHIFNPAKVLDVGCAKGFLVLAFRELGIKSFGIDISEYALSNALISVRPYLHKSRLGQDRLPFPDKYFDFISAIGIIEYIENLHHAISELRRVTNGVLYLTVGLYKRNPNSKLRLHAHNSQWWIQLLQSEGFQYSPYYGELFFKNKLKMFFEKDATWTKKRIGKFFYTKCGYFGKRITLSYYRRQFRRIGHLFFI